jgi:aldose 1-epimerase
MNIEKKQFGMLSTGEDVDLYILDNDSMVVGITNYGASITSILLPSDKNYYDDVVLGFSTLAGYTGKHPYFGAAIGRYGNRIAKGKFSLDGTDYQLALNDGANHLHGGLKGFDKVVWEAESFVDRDGLNVELYYSSPDGDEGYPGSLDVTIVYTLTENNELKITYVAESDAATPVNLTNHSYFNLRGEGNGDILGHEAVFHADRYLPVSSSLIPTGVLAPVAGTPFDFGTRKPIGRDIAAVPGGYDHCYVATGSTGALIPVAEVYEPGTGRSLKMSTDLPGFQFYTGNFLDNVEGKRGSVYGKHAGFCLETQLFPDSPNQSAFPSSILKPEETWEHITVYSFGF